MSSHVIAITNQKGGVAKTTSAIQIGVGLSRMGRKVLLIDLDPQGSLTYGCGINTNKKKTVYEAVMTGDKENLLESIVHLNGYDVVPSDMRLCNAEVELQSIPGKELILGGLLEDIEHSYDYVFIDCPPSLGVLTINAMIASQRLYVALQPESAAIEGLSMLTKTIDQLNKALGKRLGITVKIAGVIITLYKGNTSIHQAFADVAKQSFGPLVFETRIRHTIDFATAYSQHMSIYEWKPRSIGAEDYTTLCNEIIVREENGNG